MSKSNATFVTAPDGRPIFCIQVPENKHREFLMRLDPVFQRLFKIHRNWGVPNR